MDRTMVSWNYHSENREGMKNKYVYQSPRMAASEKTPAESIDTVTRIEYMATRRGLASERIVAGTKDRSKSQINQLKGEDITNKPIEALYAPTYAKKLLPWDNEEDKSTPALSMQNASVHSKEKLTNELDNKYEGLGSLPIEAHYAPTYAQKLLPWDKEDDESTTALSMQTASAALKKKIINELENKHKGLGSLPIEALYAPTNAKKLMPWDNEDDESTTAQSMQTASAALKKKVINELENKHEGLGSLPIEALYAPTNAKKLLPWDNEDDESTTALSMQTASAALKKKVINELENKHEGLGSLPIEALYAPTNAKNLLPWDNEDDKSTPALSMQNASAHSKEKLTNELYNKYVGLDSLPIKALYAPTYAQKLLPWDNEDDKSTPALSMQNASAHSKEKLTNELYNKYVGLGSLPIEARYAPTYARKLLPWDNEEDKSTPALSMQNASAQSKEKLTNELYNKYVGLGSLPIEAHYAPTYAQKLLSWDNEDDKSTTELSMQNASAHIKEKLTNELDQDEGLGSLPIEARNAPTDVKKLFPWDNKPPEEDELQYASAHVTENTFANNLDRIKSLEEELRKIESMSEAEIIKMAPQFQIELNTLSSEASGALLGNGECRDNLSDMPTQTNRTANESPNLELTVKAVEQSKEMNTDATVMKDDIEEIKIGSVHSLETKSVRMSASEGNAGVKTESRQMSADGISEVLPKCWQKSSDASTGPIDHLATGDASLLPRMDIDEDASKCQKPTYSKEETNTPMIGQVAQETNSSFRYTDIVPKSPYKINSHTDIVQESPSNANSHTEIVPESPYKANNHTDIVPESPYKTNNHTDIVPESPYKANNHTDIVPESPYKTNSQTDIMPEIPSKANSHTDIVSESPYKTNNHTDIVPESPYKAISHTDIVPESPYKANNHTDIVPESPYKANNHTDIVPESPYKANNHTDIVPESPYKANNHTDIVPESPYKANNHTDIVPESPYKANNHTDIVPESPYKANNHTDIVPESPYKANNHTDIVPESPYKANSHTDIVPESPYKTNSHTDISPELTSKANKHSDTSTELSSKVNRRHRNISPELSFKANKYSDTSPELSSKANSRSDTSPELSSKANKNRDTSPELSSKVNSRSDTSQELSSKANSRSDTSPELSSKANNRSDTSPELSSKANSRSDTSPELSSKANKNRVTSPELSFKANTRHRNISPELSSKVNKHRDTSPELSSKANKKGDTSTELSSKANRRHRNISPELSSKVNNRRDLSPELTSKANRRRDKFRELSSKANRRHRDISPELSSKANKHRDTSPELSSKVNSRSDTSQELSSKANSRSDTSPELSSKANNRSDTSPELSSKANSRSDTSPELSTKANKNRVTSPELSFKANTRHRNISPELSSKVNKHRDTSPELSSKANKKGDTSTELSSKANRRHRNISPELSSKVNNRRDLSPELTSKANRRRDKFRELSFKANRRHRDISPELSSKANKHRDTSPELSSKANRRRDKSRELSSKANSRSDTSPVLLSKANKNRDTSPELTSKANKNRDTSPELSSKANGRHRNITAELSSKANRRHRNISPGLSSKANKHSDTSPELSPKDNRRHRDLSPELSRKTNRRNDTSPEFSSKANKNRDTSPELSSKANRRHMDISLELSSKANRRHRDISPELSSKANSRHRNISPELSSKANRRRDLSPELLSKANGRRDKSRELSSKANRRHTDISPELSSKANRRHRDISPELSSKANRRHRDISPELSSKANSRHRDISPELSSKANRRHRNISPELSSKANRRHRDSSPELSSKIRIDITVKLLPMANAYRADVDGSKLLSVPRTGNKFDEAGDRAEFNVTMAAESDGTDYTQKHNIDRKTNKPVGISSDTQTIHSMAKDMFTQNSCSSKSVVYTKTSGKDRLMNDARKTTKTAGILSQTHVIESNSIDAFKHKPISTKPFADIYEKFKNGTGVPESAKAHPKRETTKTAGISCNTQIIESMANDVSKQNPRSYQRHVYTEIARNGPDVPKYTECAKVGLHKKRTKINNACISSGIQTEYTMAIDVSEENDYQFRPFVRIEESESGTDNQKYDETVNAYHHIKNEQGECRKCSIYVASVDAYDARWNILTERPWHIAQQNGVPLEKYCIMEDEHPIDNIFNHLKFDLPVGTKQLYRSCDTSEIYEDLDIVLPDRRDKYIIDTPPVPDDAEDTGCCGCFRRKRSRSANKNNSNANASTGNWLVRAFRRVKARLL